MSDALKTGLVAAFAAERAVVAGWLFGSYTTARTTPASDIDVGVLTERELDWEELLDLRDRLESVVCASDVDVTDVEAADPILAFEAVRGELLYCRDRARTAAAVSLIAREYESAMELIERGMRYRADLRG